ncbi:MAG: metallophosphoesterase family protein [Planctomycetota bacterium]
MLCSARLRFTGLDVKGGRLAKVGLLADSHGRAVTTDRAVHALLERGVDRLIHLGDIGTVEVIDALAVDVPGGDDQIEAHLVFGNTDWDIEELSDYARDLDVSVDHPLGTITLPEGVLAYCHGHEPGVMQTAIRDGATWLCHGHTHRVSDLRRGGTRVINPGALFRAAQYTVAVLDTATDSVELIDVG